MVSRTPLNNIPGFPVSIEVGKEKKNLMRNKHITNNTNWGFKKNFLAICRLTLMGKHRQKRNAV